MSNSKNNVAAGKPDASGAIYRAPLGTTLPTDATTTLSTAFKNLGYISADGVTNANTRTSTDVKAWGGDTVLAPQTDKSDIFRFTLIESRNIDALKTVFGNTNVTESSGAITIKANAKELEESVYVIQTIGRDGEKKRTVIPCGKVSEVGEVAYKDDQAIGYPVTLKALPGSDEDTHKEYFAAVTTTSAT